MGGELDSASTYWLARSGLTLRGALAVAAVDAKAEAAHQGLNIAVDPPPVEGQHLRQDGGAQACHSGAVMQCLVRGRAQCAQDLLGKEVLDLLKRDLGAVVGCETVLDTARLQHCNSRDIVAAMLDVTNLCQFIDKTWEDVSGLAARRLL